MINREITYERSVNKSYMKIPAVRETCLDEKLMFKKSYQGIVPIEKCYVDGGGQYWYNISGKQALDAYCRVNPINQKFFENLMLRICNQLELLEWNLIDANCLVLDPELIFINHSGEDVSFVLYPNIMGDFFDELQQLMEYLLTKLNHGDPEGVHQAYQIYDMTLREGYNIEDLKQIILSKREVGAEILEERQEEKKDVLEKDFSFGMKEESITKSTDMEDVFQEIKRKIFKLLEIVKGILGRRLEKREEIPMVVYPEECEEEEEQQIINPTICLASTIGQARGMLIYEGMGDYPDFELREGNDILGKNPKSSLYINRETVSQFHAKFEYTDKKYYIEDLNSTNGTYVNDELLNYKEKRVLSPGDILRFADVKYRFL